VVSSRTKRFMEISTRGKASRPVGSSLSAD
jgi:hypothetical protein